MVSHYAKKKKTKREKKIATCMDKNRAKQYG